MFKMLAHSPGLALATAGYLKALLSDGALSGAYKELIATRVSVLLGSEYASRAHAISAKQKGATDEQIAAARGQFMNGPFTQTEKYGFEAAERLHRSAAEISDEFFSELKKYFSDAQLVELFAAAAAFELFPRFVDGLRIPITPPPAAMPKNPSV
jgi:AhpD family alkylhydroperoxidase